MNRIQKIVLGIMIAGAVGITYLTSALKDFPEAFDWDNEEEDHE